MAITTNFSISALNCYPLQNGIENVVFKVDWTFIATDGQYYATIPSSTELTYIAGTSFIPFTELTQDQIITWVKAIIGDETLAQYETSLTERINVLANPTVITPILPWMIVPSTTQPEIITTIGI